MGIIQYHSNTPARHLLDTHNIIFDMWVFVLGMGELRKSYKDSAILENTQADLLST